jgi:ABC-type branched-subunit amino acid transport system ATPase component
MSSTALDVDALRVGYSATAIVEGASLLVSAGEVAVLVGPNGSGKSTLLKGIAGVLSPMGGRVLLQTGAQQDVTGMRPEQKAAVGVGYVPQVDNVFPSLTVQENLRVGAFTARAGFGSRLAYVYGLFPDLQTAARKPARALSGGQRGMLALGRALMGSPKVLLVDEPTAGLSPRFQAIVWEQLLRLRDEGVGLLVVEQNTRAALEAGDRGYVLVAGKVRRSGLCRELLQDRELVSLYIGRR